MSAWRLTPRAEERVGQVAYETIAFRVIAWAMLLVGFGFELIFARNPRDPMSAFILGAKAYILIILAQATLHFLYRRLLNHLHLGPGLKRIRAKVPDDRACPVRIRIQQQGVVTGFDEGYMWVSEGTLYFKGLQSVFRLNRDDVPEIKTWPRALRPRPNHGKLPNRLVVDTDDRQLVIDFDLIDPFEDFNTRRRAHFFQLEVMEWLVQRPKGSIESLLPPYSVHPGLNRKDFTRTETLLSAGGMMSINLILILTERFSFDLKTMPGLLGAIFLLVNVWMFFLAIRLALSAIKSTKVRSEIADLDALPPLE